MSQTWYPIIHTSKCTGCLACYKRCSHHVYELKGNIPYVANPMACITGCRRCGKLCPEDAITYFGDQKERRKKMGRSSRFFE